MSVQAFSLANKSALIIGASHPIGAAVALALAEAGANIFVAGSAIFGHDNYTTVIEEMKTACGICKN